MRITLATPLILGSASPRRFEMLSSLGIPMVVRAATVDETPFAFEPPDAYLLRIMRTKLAGVRQQVGWGLGAAILVADTVVVAPDGAVLGKPTQDEEAQKMIERLAGSTHEVKTRFAVSQAAFGAPVGHAQTVTTRVTFRALAAGEARAYVETGEGRDKAGGYAVQGRAASFVERIDGSYTNVVGLPLSEVVVAFRALDLW